MTINFQLKLAVDRVMRAAGIRMETNKLSKVKLGLNKKKTTKNKMKMNLKN